MYVPNICISLMINTLVNTGTTYKSDDYNQQIFDSLPENAKQYYYHTNDNSTTDWCYRLSVTQNFWLRVNLIRIYPIFRIKYLNSNEFIGCIVNGEHRIYQGPGYHWVSGLNDTMTEKYTIGGDISFGPIKIIYVRAGSLKFAQFRNTGKPLLLGPGMHYFNDLYLSIGNEISMNFQGNNQVIRCDEVGAFQFIFVKNGSEAIIISRDGDLKTVGPGLHFIQAPDALKSFISVQQEHIRVSSVASNQKFLTADNVELHITATIFYRIFDVKTMFTNRIKDEQDLTETIHSQAMATLLTIIRSENFQGIGKKQQIAQMDNEIRTTGIDGTTMMKSKVIDGMNITEAIALPIQTAVPSAPPAVQAVAITKQSDALDSVTMGFQNIIRDAEPQFTRMMQANFNPSGIEIQSLRIEQIEFADKSMQQQVSQFALTFTKLSSQQQTINAQRAIEVAEAEREAATLLIKSKAEASKQMLLQENQNEIKIRTAKADAEQKLLLAEAEAQAKIKIGEAEIYIQEKQNSMPNTALRIITDGQIQIFKGIQKVIYTDQQSMLLKPYMAIPDITDLYKESGATTTTTNRAAASASTASASIASASTANAAAATTTSKK